MRRQMWVRVATLFATLVASALASVTACLPEQERTTFGPAEALGPRPFPNPEPGNGAGGGGGPPDPGQICGGQGPIDAGDCTAKWSEIFAKTIAGSGTLACGKGGCHSKNSTPPEISADNAGTAWQQLTNYKISASRGGKPYINPCTKTPAESSIGCNLDNKCGQMPPGGGITADELAKINEWVQCGSPNN
ncbi:hypothetical protein LZC95_07090 [Pendulispora brunnea]|uniref:Secreted protein n=1 Tax=Pendulispora brunnea TaxID=2905690 RepID=A0ABZ2KD51_9BACT